MPLCLSLCACGHRKREPWGKHWYNIVRSAFHVLRYYAACYLNSFNLGLQGQKEGSKGGMAVRWARQRDEKGMRENEEKEIKVRKIVRKVEKD